MLKIGGMKCEAGVKLRPKITSRIKSKLCIGSSKLEFRQVFDRRTSLKTVQSYALKWTYPNWQRGRIFKSAVIVVDMISVLSLLSLFCCVFGKDILRFLLPFGHRLKFF